jgi:hypothetical protein
MLFVVTLCNSENARCFGGNYRRCFQDLRVKIKKSEETDKRLNWRGDVLSRNVRLSPNYKVLQTRTHYSLHNVLLNRM